MFKYIIFLEVKIVHRRIIIIETIILTIEGKRSQGMSFLYLYNKRYNFLIYYHISKYAGYIIYQFLKIIFESILFFEL